MRLKLESQRIWEASINQRSCLAKTERAEEHVIPGMTVYEHCAAAGLTAQVIAMQFPYLRKVGLFPAGFDLVAALHDIGKVVPSFQRKLLYALDDEETRNRLLDELGLKDYPAELKVKHAVVSYSALKESVGEELAFIEGSHHGWFADNSLSPEAEILGGKTWQAARLSLLSDLEKRFGSSLPDLSGPFLSRFLLGLTVVSDWISSSISKAELSDPDIFMRKVIESGFHPHSYRKGLSFYDIFGFGMRPEQKALADAVSGPGIYILEAGTGSGKTEAALYAAYRLLSDGMAEGLYFELPTTLTSRHIQKRVDRFLDAILEGEDGKSMLVFGNSFLYDCVFSEDFREPSWFDSRRRMILAPFGVGTIDQALMSVITVKHSAVRTFGLAGKVVILDEVHSYDAYTGLLIDVLAKQLSGLGATVIILSATLRKSARAELLGDPGILLDDSYPSVTVRNDSGIREIPVDAGPEKEVSIIHEPDVRDAMENAIDDALDGSYVLWIENTVAEAQDAYKVFSARCQGLIDIGLLHSRFLGPDRAEKEALYTELYGKEAWDRRQGGKGAILVGTQILEQSLDLDADSLYTRLAPIDMVIQRIGRLWRHEHPERKGKPVCHLIHPSSADIEKDPYLLGPSSSVYSGYILYRTAKAIESVSSLSLPDDIRTMLESVYSDRDEENGNIRRLKAGLAAKRHSLREKAFRSISPVRGIIPDTASTRYSEIEYRRVMILSRLDMEKKLAILADGTSIALSEALSPRERAIASLRLEESILDIPSRSCPSSAVPASVQSLLSRFVYMGEDDEPCILFLGKDGSLSDVSGNKLENACYSEKMGYHIIKEGALG